MARTFAHQDTQVRPSNQFDDSMPSGPALEADSESLQDDLNAIRSQIKRIIGTPAWHGEPQASLSINKLLYFISDGPAEGFAGGFREIIGAPWPTSVTWYTDAGKTAKIVEKLVSRNAEQAPTQIVWRLYDSDGTTILITSTDTITNTGTPAVFESTRSRVIS